MGFKQVITQIGITSFCFTFAYTVLVTVTHPFNINAFFQKCVMKNV